MSSNSTALGTAVDDRKARLAKLRTLKRKQPEDEIVAPTSDRQGSALPPAAGVQQAHSAGATEEQKEPTTTTKSQDEHRANYVPEESQAEAASATDDADVARMYLSGRTYDPDTRGPKLGFDLGPNEMVAHPTLEEKAREIEAGILVKAAKEEEEQRQRQSAAGESGAGTGVGGDTQIDLFKLQPKKPNWDLKRDLDKKLEVLNVRTQNAINRIVRERIEEGRRQAQTQAKLPDAQKQHGAMESVEHTGDAGGEGIDGVALVEGLKVREKEEEAEERREREEIDGMGR